MLGRRAGWIAVPAVVLAACAQQPTPQAARESSADGVAVKGGTLQVLSSAEDFAHLDPQRIDRQSDAAFASGYLHRTLTAYRFAPGIEGLELVPDMATDLGRRNADATSWSFTVRDGVTFQDGSKVGCSDIRFGVARSFATEVITDGPTYPVDLLDIPVLDDGMSVYKGPYVTEANDRASFDTAVQCSDDDSTITFNLKRPVSDFNEAVTSLVFAPVPQAFDTGGEYDDSVQSSGPYRIDSKESGGSLVLVRNENWDPASDSYRPAYPDRIIVSFGLDPSVIEDRIIADEGDDRAAVMLAGLTQAGFERVLDEASYGERSASAFDPGVRFLAINTHNVPNVKHRQAIAVAIDRAQIQRILGGDGMAVIADGVVSPSLATDYAASGVWTDLFGRSVPPSGDPDFARQLIKQSGEPMPALVYRYPRSPADERIAESYRRSLAGAGIALELDGREPALFYASGLDADPSASLVRSGWRAAWPNASTVIPELFGASGRYNLSRVEDAGVDADIEAANRATERAAQAALWQELNERAMANAWVVPTVFSTVHYIWGSQVGNAFVWDPYASMPFGDLFVRP